MKSFFLVTLVLAFTTVPSIANNYDSLIKSEEVARQRAVEALKKLEAAGPTGQETFNLSQHSHDSFVAIRKKQDSLKKDSLFKKATYERNKKIHGIEKSLNAYGNRGFTIYDGIIYFTLFIFLLVVFLFCRRLYKNKKIVFKEFYKQWKQNFKELRDKENEIEKNKIKNRIK
jgi:hypothetical protein